MARKLINRKDILNDLVGVILPKYFPEATLDTNRVSILGYLTETMAVSIEDTVTLEQRRAADYCPELSTSEVHVRQTAKIRSIGVDYATPGRAFAIIGVLKSDILNKGERNGKNEIRFTIDRRSIIMHNGIPFSLEDDIIIRATQRSVGIVYSAAYSGEYASYDSYIQMYEQENDRGQEMVTLVVQIYQFSYNIQEKIVTDEIQFLYDGIEFDYDNKLAGFDVYYKKTTSDAYTRVGKTHYLSDATTNDIYYNDDNSNILFVLNNPKLNIGANTMIKCEIRETLGTDGMITIGNDNTTFSLYRDGTYNYSGVNVIITMLSDTIDASDGDSIEDIKARLIDAKTRRDNITTEHDIITYINDIDANVQIIKKRNDIEDRRYYLYTLLRYNSEIVPANTIRAKITGIHNIGNIGDFDYYDQTLDRKVINAYNKWKLIPGTKGAEDIIVKVPHDEKEEDAFYFTSPFMILLNKYNIASYYYTSVNDYILLSGKPTNTIFPFQIITREVNIFRNAHSATESDTYKFSIEGNMNTANDDELVEKDGTIKDKEAIMCYIVFRKGNAPAAYMKMPIDSYNKESRTFTFTGQMKTNDFVTEDDYLQIVSGLYQNGTEKNYGSVIDFKDATLDVFFMYKYDLWEEYDRTDQVYSYLPKSATEGYTLMCGFYNKPQYPYDLLLEYNKFSSSSVTARKESGVVNFYISEIPLIEYEYGIKNISNMYDTFENFREVYGSLLKLTTDFDVSLKFTATYGRSKYITITGGRSIDGEEITADLNDLNPTFYFKIYGKNVDVDEIRNFIYVYLRDTYITDSSIYMSNICTLIEEKYNSVKSIKYMGVNKFDASYQEFTYTVPEFTNKDIIYRFVPEQLNVTDIQIDLEEV